MLNLRRLQVLFAMSFGSILLALAAHAQDSPASVIHGIDASVEARDQAIESYSVTEHYAVYRHGDAAHPAAEMTVRTLYRKDEGKSYTVLSESGSELIRKEVLRRILADEHVATQPANRAGAVITSANYDMSIKGREAVDGRPCILLTLVPRRNSPYLFHGDLWVDAQSDAIVKLAGVAAKSVSVFTGATQVSRRYNTIDGLPMATHATAVVNSWLLGQTTIEIDYTGYQIHREQAATAGK